jgi:ribosome-binding protein aMBF1 (putative translation factor)
MKLNEKFAYSMTNLGLEIRVARIRAELTQKELSQKLFCDQAIVSRLETGKLQVTQERLVAIAQITGIEIGDSCGKEL